MIPLWTSRFFLKMGGSTTNLVSLLFNHFVHLKLEIRAKGPGIWRSGPHPIRNTLVVSNAAAWKKHSKARTIPTTRQRLSPQKVMRLAGPEHFLSQPWLIFSDWWPTFFAFEMMPFWKKRWWNPYIKVWILVGEITVKLKGFAFAKSQNLFRFQWLN